jgi:hypothetical protein
MYIPFDRLIIIIIIIIVLWDPQNNIITSSKLVDWSPAVIAPFTVTRSSKVNAKTQCV